MNNLNTKKHCHVMLALAGALGKLENFKLKLKTKT